MNDNKNEPAEENEILSRLDVIIYLLLKEQKQLPTSKKNMEELVKMLKGLGIEDYKSIAKIINANPGSVANILTRLKGSKKVNKNVRENRFKNP